MTGQTHTTRFVRPFPTRVVTCDLELIAYFELIDAAKARGMSRTTLASELIAVGMRATGLLADDVAVHLGRGITALPCASPCEQIVNGPTS